MTKPAIQCEKLAHKLDPILSALYDLDEQSDELSRAYCYLERAAEALRIAAREMTECEVRV